VNLDGVCVKSFTKGLEFLSPSEKQLANKLLLENVIWGEFIVKKEPEEDSQSTVLLHSKRNRLYLCLLIQMNHILPLLSSLMTLMSLVSQPHLTWMTGCKILGAWGRV